LKILHLPAVEKMKFAILGQIVFLATAAMAYGAGTDSVAGKMTEKKAVVPDQRLHDKEQPKLIPAERFPGSGEPGKLALWTHSGPVPDSQSAAQQARGPEYHTQVIDSEAAMGHMRDYTAMQKAHSVVFLHSADGKPLLHPAVIDSIQQAPHAEVMPHVYNRDTSMDTLKKLQDSLHTAEFKGVDSLSAREVLHRMTAHASSSEKGPVKYVMALQNTPAESEVLHRIASMASPASPISFVALDEPSAGAIAPSRKAHYSRLLASSSDQTDGIYYSPEGAEFSIYYADTYLYITPDIFTGIMCGIFIFFTILIGMSCLSSIQTPTSFATKNPPVGREA
jgi:hypothetical protein